MSEEDFKGFHIRDSALHEFLFKVRNIIKLKHGPKTKVPYHYILRYYLHKLLLYTIDDDLAFKILLENTILDIDVDKEDYKDFHQKMEEISDEITLGV